MTQEGPLKPMSTTTSRWLLLFAAGLSAMLGNHESVPAQTSAGAVHFSNMDQASAGGVATNPFVAQRFTTGSNADGYDVGRIDIEVTATGPKGSGLRLYLTSPGSGTDFGPVLATFSRTDSPTTGVRTHYLQKIGETFLEGPGNINLEPNTTYALQVKPYFGSLEVSVAAADGAATPDGWTVENEVYRGELFTWQLIATNQAVRFALRERVVPETSGPTPGPPTPGPTVGPTPTPAPTPTPEPEPEPEPTGELRASFTVDAECHDDLCRALTDVPVRFVDTSSGPVRSRTWTFGVDGSASAGTLNRAWVEPGFYDVTLTVTDGVMQSTASRKFLVTASDPAGTCEPDRWTLCLQRSRFAVRVDWSTADGDSGNGIVVREGTDDSGMFWFFEPTNWEALLKVLDGCEENGHLWVFSASTTDVGYRIEVTDTAGGQVKEYRNEPGAPAPAITDSTAFPESCET